MASSTLSSLFASPIIFSVNNGLGGSHLLKDKGSGWNSTDYLLPALTLTEEQATSGDSFDGIEILNNDPVKVSAARNNSPTSETLSELILSEDKKTPREVIYIDSKRRHKYYKTELCRSWDEFGFCRYGTNCQFAHGKSELMNVVRHPKYKTVACRSYATFGYCYYGARCRFLHKNAPTPILETAAFRDWSGQVLFRRLPVFIKLSLGHVIGKSPEELSTQLFSFE